jgi:hypothetical protein
LGDTIENGFVSRVVGVVKPRFEVRGLDFGGGGVKEGEKKRKNVFLLIHKIELSTQKPSYSLFFKLLFFF